MTRPSLISLLLLSALASTARAQTAPLPDIARLVREHGRELGVEAGPKGLVYHRADLGTGQSSPVDLDNEAASAVARFLERASSSTVDAEITRGLEAYLRLNPAPELEKRLFVLGPDGVRRPTPLGRNLFMDILTAKDGTLFKEPRAAAKPGGKALSLDRFDWTGWEKGRQDGQWTDGLQAYAFSAGRETTRVLVEGRGELAQDRLRVEDGGAASVYREAGLESDDVEALSSQGATLKRAFGNLLVLEVPTPNAAALGLALEKKGLESRPARIFESADVAARRSVEQLARGAGAAAPLLQALPLPTGPGSPFSFGTRSASGGDLLEIAGLWSGGMSGEGATVGLIDTGVDESNADFKGRIARYEDLTGEGNKDYHGHGTHVAGIIGGSGENSRGEYKGVAPGVKYVVFKVFDKIGRTSEDTILAAMRKAAELPKEFRPQVLNMSLGGRGDPESDPLAAMANKLTLRENILVVAAAGNAGPELGTVGAPGNAEYALSVGGVTKKGEPSWFASRGPVPTKDGYSYSKPDIAAIAGDVTLAPGMLRALTGVESLAPALNAAGAAASSKAICVYAPGGVISSRSSDDADTSCLAPDNANYRYLSGTSMAAPMASGAAAGVAGYLGRNAAPYSATQVKAALVESAADIGQKPEIQGAGLLNGRRLAQAVADRVKAGVPVGNIAYMLSMRLTSEQRKKVDESGRFQRTALGVVDFKTGRLVNDDAQLRRLIDDLIRPPAIAAKPEERKPIPGPAA